MRELPGLAFGQRITESPDKRSWPNLRVCESSGRWLGSRDCATSATRRDLRSRWPKATASDVVMEGLSRHPASAW